MAIEPHTAAPCAPPVPDQRSAHSSVSTTTAPSPPAHLVPDVQHEHGGRPVAPQRGSDVLAPDVLHDAAHLGARARAPAAAAPQGWRERLGSAWGMGREGRGGVWPGRGGSSALAYEWVLWRGQAWPDTPRLQQQQSTLRLAPQVCSTRALPCCALAPPRQGASDRDTGRGSLGPAPSSWPPHLRHRIPQRGKRTPSHPVRVA